MDTATVLPRAICPVPGKRGVRKMTDACPLPHHILFLWKTNLIPNSKASDRHPQGPQGPRGEGSLGPAWQSTAVPQPGPWRPRASISASSVLPWGRPGIDGSLPGRKQRTGSPLPPSPAQPRPHPAQPRKACMEAVIQGAAAHEGQAAECQGRAELQELAPHSSTLAAAPDSGSEQPWRGLAPPAQLHGLPGPQCAHP